MRNKDPSNNRRLLPLFLTLCIMVSLMAFPASAEELGGTYIDLLTYTTPDGLPGYTTTISPDKKTVNFQMPFATDIAYIDVIFSTDSQSFTDVYSTDGNALHAINYRHIGNGLYRAYGAVTYSQASMTALLFDPLDGTYNITFHRFTVFTEPTTNDLLSADVELTRGTETVDSLSYNGTPLYHNWQIYNEDWNAQANFQLDIELSSEWTSYDYVDIVTTLTVSEISSIGVTAGDTVVPFTVNQTSPVNGGEPPEYYITLRLDLTGLDRTGESPVVSIRGIAVQIARGVNEMWIHSICGFVAAEEPNVLAYFFSQVGAWIQSQTTALTNAIGSGVNNITTVFTTWGKNIVDGVSGVTSAIGEWGENIVNALTVSGDTSEFQEDVDNARQELENASDAMDDFTRPAVDEVIPDLDTYLETDNASYFGQAMEMLLGDEVIYILTYAGVGIWLIGLVFGV